MIYSAGGCQWSSMTHLTLEDYLSPLLCINKGITSVSCHEKGNQKYFSIIIKLCVIPVLPVTNMLVTVVSHSKIGFNLRQI